MPGSCSTMRCTFESAGTRRGQPGVEQGTSFMGATLAQDDVDGTMILKFWQ
jgi:hypothetical protein